MGEGAVDAGIDTTGRLATARAVLRRVEDRAVGAHPAVEPGADGRLLPVATPLAGLLPAGGLRRGSTVAVAAGVGSTSLLMALLARASGAGAWVGVVGRPELGLVAAAEAGVALERLALVPYPGADLVAVAAALLDGLDLVAVAVPERGMPAADRQRLAARARQRGAVLLPLGSWPGADAELSCTQVQWQGVGGRADGGVGRLCARRTHVRLRGRGVAPGGHSVRLLLPGAAGLPEVDAAAVPSADATTTLIESREAG
jgi:NADPH:quinone reductase-like Zn-dependent oxidoreductase